MMNIDPQLVDLGIRLAEIGAETQSILFLIRFEQQKQGRTTKRQSTNLKR